MAALHRQLAHLYQNNYPKDTHLTAVFDTWKNHILCGEKNTASICSIICANGPELGFSEADVSALSLCARGNVELILVHFDTDTIRLVIKWHIYTILQ